MKTFAYLGFYLSALIIYLVLFGLAITYISEPGGLITAGIFIGIIFIKLETWFKEIINSKK